MVWACEKKRGRVHWKKWLSMELPGKRGRGRPKRRFMDAIREDLEVVKIREEDALDRRKWKGAIRCGDP